MNKQRVVEHDQLVHEFETLTSDLDGLLGLLENALDNYNGDAAFEARKLLCAQFQVSECMSLLYTGSLYSYIMFPLLYISCRKHTTDQSKLSSIQYLLSLSHCLKYRKPRQKRWRMPVEATGCCFMHSV